MQGEFVKIEEFTLVIIFVIFLQNDNLGLKMKVLKFLGIQPNHELLNIIYDQMKSLFMGLHTMGDSNINLFEFITRRLSRIF